MDNINLSPEEIQTPRVAADLYTWVLDRIESIKATPHGKSAIRFRKGLCKPLIEELLPLGLLCECYFERSPEVTVELVLGNQNYDAKVTDRRRNAVAFTRIEVTQSHEGEDEHLRMLHLEQEGHVSLLGPVHKSGTKKTGISVSVASEAKSHTEVVNSQRTLLQEAIGRKLTKPYDRHTALLVVFDDSIAIRNDSDCGVFRNLLLENRATLLGRFAWVGVIGWRKKCFTYIED
jgi:hypothetical protein